MHQTNQRASTLVFGDLIDLEQVPEFTPQIAMCRKSGSELRNYPILEC